MRIPVDPRFDTVHPVRSERSAGLATVARILNASGLMGHPSSRMPDIRTNNPVPIHPDASRPTVPGTAQARRSGTHATKRRSLAECRRVDQHDLVECVRPRAATADGATDKAHGAAAEDAGERVQLIYASEVDAT